MRRWLGMVAVAMLLSGCALIPPPPAPSLDDQFDELRQYYGLPDCPVTAPDVEGVAGGLPQTELPCLGSGRMVNLAGLPRQPMVLNFWAQWCEPCRQEAPFLRDLAAARDDIDFIGINYDDDAPELAIEFAGLAGLAYPHVRDRHKQLATLGVPGLPVTFFVTSDGRIAGRHVGVLESADQLARLVDEYLGES